MNAPGLTTPFYQSERQSNCGLFKEGTKFTQANESNYSAWNHKCSRQRHIGIKFYESCCKKETWKSSHQIQPLLHHHHPPIHPETPHEISKFSQRDYEALASLGISLLVVSILHCTVTVVSESHVLKRQDVSNLVIQGGWLVLVSCTNSLLNDD